MAQPKIDVPHDATGEQIGLLQAIKAGQDENDAEISLVLNSLNKGVAQLVAKNGKIITDLQGKVLKQLNQRCVDNDNHIDALSTAILGWGQNELSDVHMLLTQLAASAGATSPGDPLEAALVDQLAAAPDIAYSATLLMALREGMPILALIARTLQEIRDRMPGTPVRYTGEAPTGEKSEFDDEVDLDADADGQPVQFIQEKW
jgi:hypothetical protein